MMTLFPNTDLGSSFHAYNMCGYEFYFSQVKYHNFTEYLGPYRCEHFEMIIERDNQPVVKIMACGEERRLITPEECIHLSRQEIIMSINLDFT